MVLRPDPKQPLDALILVPPGSLSDFAEDLGAELVTPGDGQERPVTGGTAKARGPTPE
jgi:hypothetical protein